MGPWSNARTVTVDPRPLARRGLVATLLQRQRCKVIQLVRCCAHGWLSNIMCNELIDGDFILPACSTRCAERITFASLEDTCLYFRCCCQRACGTFVGSGCPRLQAMGLAGNPGWWTAQASGHVC